MHYKIYKVKQNGVTYYIWRDERNCAHASKKHVNAMHGIASPSLELLANQLYLNSVKTPKSNFKFILAFECLILLILGAIISGEPALSICAILFSAGAVMVALANKL